MVQGPMEEIRALAFAPRIPGAFSILCSGYIAYSVLSDHQKRASPRERIVLGVSCSDIQFSFFFFLSTWPIPHGTDDIYGAVGNTRTCRLQGFFIQLGIMTPMYNGFLSLYCFLFVCRNWGKKRLKYVEISGHIFIFIFGLSTAIAGLPLNLYHPYEPVCWIAPNPYNCTQSYYSKDGTTDCIHGDNADIYRWVFFYGVLWFNLFWTSLSMLLIYLHVRKQEKIMAAYVNEYSEMEEESSESRKVAFRGALFSVAFLITWVPLIIQDFLWEDGEHGPIVLAVVVEILVASQGIFNFFFYMQPSISSYLKGKREKRRKGETSLINAQSSSNQDATKNEDLCKTEEKAEEHNEDISPAAELALSCVHSSEDNALDLPLAAK